MLAIGAFSRLSNVSIKTLRFYHEIGLFRPAHVQRSTGYRYYTPKQLDEIRSILAFKDMGFGLEEIEEILRQNISSGALRDKLAQKRSELETRLHEASKQIERINNAFNQVENGLPILQPEISVKQIRPQLVASIRDILRSYESASGLFDELLSFAKRRCAPGTPGAVWHSCLSGGTSIDCEAFIFLDRPMTGTRRIRVYELPAATAACALHKGDADFTASYANANRWIATNDWHRNGPNREIYLHGGYSEGDSAVMEIQFPVEAKQRVS